MQGATRVLRECSVQEMIFPSPLALRLCETSASLTRIPTYLMLHIFASTKQRDVLCLG